LFQTPSGHILASTNYKDGYFHFHLANPIEDGSYTCRVPQQHVASACLHGNHNATGQASVVVDRMEARMTLMEAEVRSLRHDKLQLEQQVTVLQNNLTQKVDILDNQFTQKVNNLQNDLTQKADLNDLTQNFAVLKNNLTQQAASFNDLDKRMSLELGLLMTNVTHMIHGEILCKACYICIGYLADSQWPFTGTHGAPFDQDCDYPIRFALKH